MNLKNSADEYATLMADVATLAKYNLEYDTARENALIDELHRGDENRPTQANEPPMPRGDMNIELALLCAVGGNHDPFKDVWRRLPKQIRDGSKEKHDEFAAACASGNWREIWKCAERLASYIPYLAKAAEQEDADHKLIEEIHEAVRYLSDAMKRESKEARKAGRANHRKGTK